MICQCCELEDATRHFKLLNEFLCDDCYEHAHKSSQDFVITAQLQARRNLEKIARRNSGLTGVRS